MIANFGIPIKKIIIAKDRLTIYLVPYLTLIGGHC
jgi:hypothetical protein